MRNFVLLLILLIGVSCSTTKYIEKEVPITVTKTEYVQNIRYDSIYVHDSINMYTRKDTVFKDKTKTYYKLIIEKDTVIITDSIPYPVRIVETKIEKINYLTWYQKIFNSIGIVSVLIFSIYICKKIK